MRNPRHLIVFRRENEVIEVIRVLHNARDIERHVGGEHQSGPREITERTTGGLPEDRVNFVATPAPAKDAYFPADYMGQRTTILPSRDMVIVRLGPSPGGLTEYLERVLLDILAAVGSGSGDGGARLFPAGSLVCGADSS